MSEQVPSLLDPMALARRLAELAGEERGVQADFLLHLDEFDRRRAYLDAGYGSLWDYCLRALHLREGAAGRRIGAMRILRRFPRLEPALRDGRLCLSTASVLGQILTEESLDDLVARAAYRTKAEVEQLVVSMRPRAAPADGLRRLPANSPEERAAALPMALLPGPILGNAGRDPELAPQASPAPIVSAPPIIAPARASVAEVRPVAEDRWSLRVTLDGAVRRDLETLKALLSHKIPDGDLGAVLREAIRCGLAKYAARRGASAPARERRGRASEDERHIPAAVRRAVWKRDGGRCTFEGTSGHRCGSCWRLELDHVVPVALGGASTIENLRLRCRAHNLLEAERVYGREHMEQFQKGAGEAG